jgi:hypothetical protein
MKTLFTFIFLVILTLGVNAQLLRPITFEGDTAGNASWVLGGTGTAGTEGPDFAIVPNPAKSSVNSSDSVMLFKVSSDAATWVLMWSDAYGTMTFTDAAHTLYMMVYKSVISNCAFKLEQSSSLPTDPDGGPTVMEIKVPNTLTDEWDVVAIEMTPAIGFNYNRLVVFPDFPDSRTEGSINYIDNIYNSSMVSVKQLAGASLKIFPNPVENRMAVLYPEMTGLTISNLLGKTVRSIKFQPANSKVIELGDLNTGIYFISVETGSGCYTSKFVKK